MFFQDLAWAFYVASVKSNAAVFASFWAVILFLLGAALVLGYTRDRTLLIPAALGAWLGTFAGVHFA